MEIFSQITHIPIFLWKCGLLRNFFVGFKLNTVKLDLADRYRIKLLFEEGRSTSEIARIMGVSQRTVQYVLSRPLVRMDEEEVSIKRFIEKHPHYSPQRIAQKLGVSLYRVYKVIKLFLDVPSQTEEDRKALRLAGELIEKGRVEDAARLIHMITLLPRDHAILMKIPDGLLEPSYRLSKIRYKMFNWGVPLEEIMEELEDFIGELRRKGLVLYYYQAHILKFSILNYNGRFEEVVDFYRKHRKRIMSLPYGIRINLIAPVVEASVSLSRKSLYVPLIRYLHERVKRDEFEVEWHRSITRQVYFSAMHLLGIYDGLSLLTGDDSPLVRALYLLGAGRYEEVAYMGEMPSGKLYILHMIIIRNMARVMAGLEEEPITGEYEELLNTNPVSYISYLHYMALKEVRNGDREKAFSYLREILKESKEGILYRIYRAIVESNPDVLMSTPREVLLRYWMKQDVGRAVSYALRRSMIFPLHEYALFRPPSSIRAYRYDVLLPVLPPPSFRVEGNVVCVGSRRIRVGRSRVDRAFMKLLRSGAISRLELDSRQVSALLRKYFPLVRLTKYEIRLFGNPS